MRFHASSNVHRGDQPSDSRASRFENFRGRNRASKRRGVSRLGTTPADTIYNPGENPSEGAIFQSAGGVTQRVEFFGLEPVEVRGTEGSFGCGASACFLDWEEFGVSYTVGEFGDPQDAVAFAESLEPIDQLLEVFGQCDVHRD